MISSMLNIAETSQQDEALFDSRSSRKSDPAMPRVTVSLAAATFREAEVLVLDVHHEGRK